jgi:hypothetical protein
MVDGHHSMGLGVLIVLVLSDWCTPALVCRQAGDLGDIVSFVCMGRNLRQWGNSSASTAKRSGCTRAVQPGAILC